MEEHKEKLLRRFQALFAGHGQFYGRFPHKGETFSDGKPIKPWTETKKPLVDNMWVGHLSGKSLGLGIVPVNENGMCVFGAIDYDTKPEEADHQKVLRGIIDNNLPLVLCRSKSGGDHLYVFGKEPIPAQLIRDRLKEWAMVLGIHAVYRNGRNQVTEIFPKQSAVSINAQGNWINLPYYDVKQTLRYAFDPKTGEPIGFEQFLDLAEASAVSLEHLSSMSTSIKSMLHPESPPCLQVLDRDGFPNGTRNEGLLNIGLLLEKIDDTVWEQQLRDYNLHRMDPPLTDHEVDGVIKSLRRDFAGPRKYTYGCTKPPINTVCNRELCKKQVYGIDSFEASACTAIENLVKIDVDPPRWLAYVDGTPIDVSTEQLLDGRAFRKRAMEVLNNLIKVGDAKQWYKMVDKLLDNLTVIEAPEDAGTFGQFKSHVNRFLERRQNENLAYVARHLPYENGEWIYFKSESLITFLVDKCKFRDYKPNEVYSALRRMGGEHDKPRKLPGSRVNVNLWKLPKPKDDSVEPENIDEPTNPGDAF